MKVQLFELSELISDMAKNKQDIDHYSFVYSHIIFDVVIDISVIPFELMIAAKGYNWSVILTMEKGYSVSLTNDDYYNLRNIMNLQVNPEPLTSFKFLKYLAVHAPKHCSHKLVNPKYIMPFRKYKITPSDDPEKIVFIGWNDHRKDGKMARNFKKTELFLGKQCADYCRRNNISSLWTTPENAINIKSELKYPWE